MKNKNVLKLVILILILLIITGWQFKPKQKKMSKKENEGIFEEKEMIGGIDLRKIEENFKSIQNKIMQMENKDKIELKYEKSKPLKNPLKSWLIKKESEKTVIPEIQEEKPISIIKSEPKKPDFKISGIVYDKKISYVIIND
ncbi:MAG TPA: hypothetical protein PKV21_09280, partial [bacterium]|nr:hypothetical protein [bacterium]